MRTFFERYGSGECQFVWDELHSLGGDVRNPGIIEDAREVAQETVRRATLNLKIIIARLTAVGYRFEGTSERGEILADPPQDIVKRLAAFERALGGPLPLILTAWYQQVGSVSLMGSHSLFCPQTPENGAAGLEKLSAAQLSSVREQVTPDPFVMYSFDESSLDQLRFATDPARRLANAQARLRDFDETLARTRESTAAEFPNIFAEIEKRLAPEREKLEQRVREAAKPVVFQLAVGPDDIMKFGESGDSYYVALPDPGADFVMRMGGSEETFVNYLRRSFRCGGFAGWDGLPNIPRELADLGSTLLPL